MYTSEPNHLRLLPPITCITTLRWWTVCPLWVLCDQMSGPILAKHNKEHLRYTEVASQLMLSRVILACLKHFLGLVIAAWRMWYTATEVGTQLCKLLNIARGPLLQLICEHSYYLSIHTLTEPCAHLSICGCSATTTLGNPIYKL